VDVLAGAVAVAVLACGCGRIGFDELSGSDGGDGGGSAFVISTTQLTTAPGFSWVALDVDWGSSLAYVGTREAGRCVAVVDFADEQAPFIVGWVATGNDLCLDVELIDGQRLALISRSNNSLMLYSLGADPRAGSYTIVDATPTQGPRHFAVDTVGASRRFLVVTDGSPALWEVELIGNGFVPVNQWPGTCTLPYQAVTSIGTRLALGCQDDNSPIELIDRASYSPHATIPNTWPGISGVWNATTTPTNLVVMLGLANIVLDDTTVVGRWQTTYAYRDVIATGGDVVWASASGARIEVLSFADRGVVRMIGEATLGTGGEAYAVRLDPARRRGITVTNNGYFVVFDPANIPTTDVIR